MNKQLRYIIQSLVFVIIILNNRNKNNEISYISLIKLGLLFIPLKIAQKQINKKVFNPPNPFPYHIFSNFLIYKKDS